MAGAQRRTEDFFVEFGSNAARFSDQLRTDLSGAHTEVELLDAALQQLDRNISRRGAAGQGSSMFANLAQTVTEISKLPGSFRTIAGDLGGVVDALQTAIRKISNVDLTPARGSAIGAVAADVTPAPTPAQKATRKRAAKRTEAAERDAQVAADQQAVASEATATAAKKTATAAKKATKAAARQAEAVEDMAQVAEQQAQQTEQKAAQARRAPKAGRRLATATGEIVLERTKDELEQFLANSTERFQALLSKLGSNITLPKDLGDADFDRAIKEVLRLQNSMTEVIDDVADQAKKANDKLKAGASAAAPVATPARPAAPPPAPVVTRTRPRGAEEGNRQVIGFDIGSSQKELVKAPISRLEELAGALGVGVGGNKPQLASRIAKALAEVREYESAVGDATDAARDTAQAQEQVAQATRQQAAKARQAAAAPVTDSDAQLKLDAQRVQTAMGMNREQVKAMPRPDLQALAGALGVQAGGNQSTLAKRVNDQLDAARNAAAQATELATREALQQASATQDATEATQDNEAAQERVALAATGLAVAEEQAERALEEMAQRVNRIGRRPPSEIDAARGRVTAANNEIARLKEGLQTGTLGSLQDPQSFAARIARQEEIRDSAQQIVNEGRLAQLQQKRGEYQLSLQQQIASKMSTTKGFGRKEVQPGLKLVGAEGVAEILSARAMPATEGTNNPAVAARRVVERLRASIVATLDNDADRVAASGALDKLVSDKSIQSLLGSTKGFQLPDLGGDTAQLLRDYTRDAIGSRPGAGLTRGLDGGVRGILESTLQDVAAVGQDSAVEQARAFVRRLSDRAAGADIPDNMRDVAGLDSSRMVQRGSVTESRRTYDLDAMQSSNLLRTLIDQIRTSPRRAFGLPEGGGTEAPLADLIRQVVSGFQRDSTVEYRKGLAAELAPGRLTGGVIEGQTGSVTRLPFNSAQVRQPQFANLTPEEASDPQIMNRYASALETVAQARETQANMARGVALDLLRADPTFNPFTPGGYGLARPKLAKGVREDEDERKNRLEAVRATRPISDAIAGIDRYTVTLGDGINELTNQLRGSSGDEAEGFRALIADLRATLNRMFGEGANIDAIMSGAREREAVRAVQDARQEMRRESARTGVDSLRTAFNQVAFSTGQGQSSRSLQNVGTTSREAQTGATLFGSDGRAVPARQPSMEDFDQQFPNASPAQRALFDQLTNLRRGTPNKRNPRRRSGGIEGSLRAIGRVGQQLTAAMEADDGSVESQARIAELQQAKAKADQKYQDAIDRYIEGFDQLFGASDERDMLSREEITERNRIAREERQAYLDLVPDATTSDRDLDIQRRAREQQEKEGLLEGLRRKDLTDARGTVTTDATGQDLGPVTGLEDLLARDAQVRKRFEEADRRAAQAARGAAGAAIPQAEQAALSELIGATETGPTAEIRRAAQERIDVLKQQVQDDRTSLATTGQVEKNLQLLAGFQAERALIEGQKARRAGYRVNEDTRLEEVTNLASRLAGDDVSPKERKALQARLDYIKLPTVQQRRDQLAAVDDKIAGLEGKISSELGQRFDTRDVIAGREREIADLKKVVDAPAYSLTTDQYRQAERTAQFQRSAAVRDAAEAQRDIPLKPIFAAAGGSVNQLADAVDEALGVAATVARESAAKAKVTIANAVEDAIEDGARQGAAAAAAGINEPDKPLSSRLGEAELVSAATDASQRSAAAVKALSAADRLSADLAARQAGAKDVMSDRARSTQRNILQRFLGEKTGDLNDTGYAELIDRARGAGRSAIGGLDQNLVALGDSIGKQLVAGSGGGGPIDVRVVSFGSAAISVLSNLRLKSTQPRTGGAEGDDDDPNRVKPTGRRRATRPQGPPAKAEQPGLELSDVRQVPVRELYEAALATSQGNLLAAAAEPELTAEKLRQIQAGTVDPIVREADGQIRDGFHRIAAAAAAGIENLPVRDVIREVDENQPKPRRETKSQAEKDQERLDKQQRARDVERANLPGNIGQLLAEGRSFDAARRLADEGYRPASAISLVKRQLGLGDDEATALRTELTAARAADRKAGRKPGKSADQVEQERADAEQAARDRADRVRAARTAERQALPRNVQDLLGRGEAGGAAAGLVETGQYRPGEAVSIVGRQLELEKVQLDEVREGLQDYLRQKRNAARASKEQEVAQHSANEALEAEQKRLARINQFLGTFTEETQQAIAALQGLLTRQRELQGAGQPVPDGLRDDIERARVDVAGRVTEEQRSQRYVDSLGRSQSVIPPNIQAIRLRDILDTSGPETARIGREGAAAYTRSFADGIQSQRSGFESALFGNGGFFGRLFATGGSFIIREFAGNFIFGISNIIQESFRQALATEAEFVRISNGLETLDAPTGDISNLRNELSKVSTDMGLPLADVFNTASQLVGVFEDPIDIGIASRAVQQLQVISNGALNAKEGVQSLAAATEAFPGMFEGARGLQDLVDLATQIQNVTGVNLEDQLKGMATLGPQAQALGLDPTAALLIPGLAAKRTGQTGDAASEQVSRIFASLGSGRGERALINAGIDQALVQRQEFQQIYQDLLVGLSEGTISQEQVQELVQAVGPRQARVFQALLQNPEQTLEAFAKAEERAGAGAERVEKIMETLGKRIQVLRQNFTNLIVNLIKIGALDAFGAMIVGANEMLGALNKMLLMLSAFQDSNPFIEFMSKAIFLAAGFAVMMKAAGIASIAFKQRVAQMGIAGTPGGNPAAAGGAVRYIGGAPIAGSGGVGGGLPIMTGGTPVYPGGPNTMTAAQARVAQGALSGGQGGVRGAFASGLGAAQAGRFGSNLLLGSAGTLTRFASNMGIATSRMDGWTKRLAQSQAAIMGHAQTTRRAAIMQGAASGLFTAALIALPFLISAISRRRQTAKDVEDRGVSLFGEEPDSARDKERSEQQKFIDTVVESETSFGSALIDAYTDKDKLLAGVAGLVSGETASNVGEGLISLFKGDGFKLGDNDYASGRILDNDADLKAEEAEAATASERVALLRGSLMKKINTAGGDLGELNKTLEEVDNEYRKIISDTDLSELDKAYLQDELLGLKEGLTKKAKSLREAAMNLADADKLTSEQLLALGGILQTATSLGPQTRQKYGTQLYKNLVDRDLISEGSAIGEAQRILMGADLAVEGKRPDGFIGPIAYEKFEEAPDLSLRERQAKARQALEDGIKQLEGQLIEAAGTDDEEKFQQELDAAIQMWNQITADMLAGAIASARALADLKLSSNDNKGAIAELRNVTGALEASLGNLEAGSAEYIQTQVEIQANKRRIAELSDETSINGGAGINSMMLEAARTRDPALRAKRELDIARRKLRTAKNSPGYSAAEIRDLEIAVIGAEEAAAQVARSIASSAANLAIAVANAAGDNVESARLQLEESERLLNEAVAEGLGTEEINNRRSKAVSDQAAYRDAIVGETMSDLAFGFEMERLSSNAYISGLQDLLKRSDLTKQQKQDIERQIKQLQDDLKSELTGSGFNIPDQIKLPTAYEVRRSLGLNPIGAQAGVSNSMSVSNTYHTEVNNTVSSPAMVEAVSQRVVELIAAQTQQGARASTTSPSLVRY